MGSLDTLSIGELRAHAIKTYRVGEGSRPEVSLIQVGDAQAVLKDFGRSALWFGRIFGPLLAWREARALRRLVEVYGVPKLIRQVNARALLIEHVEGLSTKAIPHGSVQPELFDRLGRLVREVHQHGVAHCDLRTRGNIIVGRDGQPYLVDFAAHIGRGRRWNLPWRWAFAQFCKADLVSVVRLKERQAPNLLTAEEQRQLELDRTRPVGRIARGIRNLTQRVLQKERT
ncbi:MAG: hypothetical protein GTO41_06720 [Burkholderiales bacterium]|nr:hypothetical protein [Burkholderiales bacterium]